GHDDEARKQDKNAALPKKSPRAPLRVFSSRPIDNSSLMALDNVIPVKQTFVHYTGTIEIIHNGNAMTISFRTGVMSL
ncbi:hypothetical protein ACCS53_39510, partial [Rhizobium ruizarguesonis]